RPRRGVPRRAAHPGAARPARPRHLRGGRPRHRRRPARFALPARRPAGAARAHRARLRLLAPAPRRRPRRRNPRAGAVVTVAAGVLALAVGTYAFRWAGPALRSRVRFPHHARRLLEIGAVVLLAALAAVTTLPLGTGEM